MSKKNSIIIFIGFITILLLFTSEKKKEINWFPSYSIKHKIPFGTYVLFDLAKNKLNLPVKEVKETPFIFLKKDTLIHGNYLIYNDVVQLGKTNTDALLNWVKKGNNLFLFTKKINRPLEDTLGVRIYSHINLQMDSILDIDFTEKPYQLKNPVVFKRPYIAQSVMEFSNDSIPENKYTTLAVLQDSLPHFVVFPYGEGRIYLHTIPEVMTNYFVLQDKNYQYIEGILNYLNNGETIYWDTRYQYGSGANGIFKVLMSTPAFLWAYRLLFAGVILFIFFEGKRKQRPVPVIKPPVNESLHFTETIAHMYLNKKEHKEIAMISIQHFMDWLKNSLYLDILKPEEQIKKDLLKKTKLKEEDIKKLFQLINEIKRKEKVKAQEGIELDKLINTIKNGI